MRLWSILSENGTRAGPCSSNFYFFHHLSLRGIRPELLNREKGAAACLPSTPT